MAYTTIDKPTDYFNTVTYSGNGSSTQAITGVGHQPDWVWIKSRSSGSENHMLSDVVRGSTKRLRSDVTNAEDDLGSNGIQSFNTDGFTAGDGDAMNASGQTYVAWNWKAGGSASSNSDGSVTSSVSANTTAGFSIVSYTGSGSNVTVGHGLGAVPKMIICKSRGNTDGSTTAARNWGVYHAGIASDAETDVITLDTTNAASDDNAPWNDTAPTSSVWSMGNDDRTNLSNLTYIAYLFAEKKGYSKFGSYTGNGSTDGAFVYTGFKPAWVMIKRTDTTGNWLMYDNKRNTFNLTGSHLAADENRAESTESTGIDFVSNGIKMRNTFSNLNASSGTYIYMAFAESPFTNSNGIPTNAR